MNIDDGKRFEQVVQRMAPGSRLLRAWRLEGGFSAEVIGLEIELPDGAIEKALLRRHGPVDLAANPDIAADEYRLLEIARAAGLRVPAPLFLDRSTDLFPTPYMVVEFIEGETRMESDEPVAFARQLAAILAGIHSVDWFGVDLSFLPDQSAVVARRLAKRPAQLDDALSEGEIRDALEASWPLEQANASRLLHGDFWPGNLLWRDSELAAIIDWEDAVYGDPLSDLAVSRLDTLWFFGPDAMDAFTAEYQASMPGLAYTNLALWDLVAAQRHAGKLSGWGLERDERQRMEALHREFVVGAVRALCAS
jgi:aminoglycoside phosphotransferase (APT) family kinase protein